MRRRPEESRAQRWERIISRAWTTWRIEARVYRRALRILPTGADLEPWRLRDHAACQRLLNLLNARRREVTARAQKSVDPARAPR